MEEMRVAFTKSQTFFLKCSLSVHPLSAKWAPRCHTQNSNTWGKVLSSSISQQELELPTWMTSRFRFTTFRNPAKKQCYQTTPTTILSKLSLKEESMPRKLPSRRRHWPTSLNQSEKRKVKPKSMSKLLKNICRWCEIIYSRLCVPLISHIKSPVLLTKAGKKKDNRLQSDS